VRWRRWIIGVEEGLVDGRGIFPGCFNDASYPLDDVGTGAVCDEVEMLVITGTEFFGSLGIPGVK
jgi:hypothetical protein